MNWKFVTEASLLKKTLLATGAMVGAVVLFVGTLSLAAVLIAAGLVGPSAPSGAPVKLPAGASSAAPKEPRSKSNTSAASPQTGRHVEDTSSASKPKPI